MPTISAPTENRSNPTYTSSTGGGPSGRAAFFLELRGDIVPYLNLPVFGRLNHNADGRLVIDIIEADFAQIFALPVRPVDEELVPLRQSCVAAQADLDQLGPVASPLAGIEHQAVNDGGRFGQSGDFTRIRVESLDADEFLQDRVIAEQLVFLVGHRLVLLLEVDDFVGVLVSEGDLLVAGAMQLVVDLPHIERFVAAGASLVAGDLGLGADVFQLGPCLREIPLQLGELGLFGVRCPLGPVGRVLERLFGGDGLVLNGLGVRFGVPGVSLGLGELGLGSRRLRLPVGLDRINTAGKTHQQDAERDLHDNENFADSRHYLLLTQPNFAEI